MTGNDQTQPSDADGSGAEARRSPTPGDAPTSHYAGPYGHPSHIGPFRILRRIGEGGMGIVYEAEQDRPHRLVALKIVRPGIVPADVLRRFELEGEFLGRLQHPGIAQVHVFGTAPTPAGESPFIAMELVDGVQLNLHARALDTRGRMELLAKVCDAVAHAHANGVIHRDLKPSNILVTAAGEPKVLDFGVARLIDADTALRTRTGQIIGHSKEYNN